MKFLSNSQLPKHVTSERGSTAVEFSLFLPLLVVLVFGMIDFGLLIWQKEVLVNATREGARQGILFGAGNGKPEIEIAVAQAISDGGLNASGLNIKVTGVGTGAGNPLAVTSSLPFQFIVADKLIPGISRNTLTASITMMNEG
jgi:Flp pilus assembly protein TadG